MGETKTVTLTDFILARIVEDEAVARAAVIPAHDGYRPHPELVSWTYREGSEVEYASTPQMAAHPYHSPIYVTHDDEGLLPAVDESIGPHIARHDPSRVLAECAAKRRIVEVVGGWSHTTSEDCWYSCAATYGTDDDNACCNDGRAGTGCDCGLDYRVAQVLAPLALPYADHPDYRAEWAD